ncbi:hypothetical protein BVC80_9041g3 [Macleaya cordata]|uniref:Uncharacterized protein n=1 Tax=Macleaya cordata TaxID=56857 RepID=A0A200R2Q9_MACCD|nr:hypothetical protein BVC80_9041g3 [Macleaya cordata]
MWRASRSQRWRRRWLCCYGSSFSSEPIIQLENDHRIQPREDDDMLMGGEQGGEVSIWQRNILMGEKCQLPEFSGVIVYDSDGNLVAPVGGSRVGVLCLK